MKLRGEVEPEPWGDWLIVPTLGYLEMAESGPWPWSKVEYVEVEPSACGVERAAAAFTTAGLQAEVVGDAVRVICAGAAPDNQADAAAAG
jgi:hypothetical protein